MTPLTSAQCLAIAERKIGEAIGDCRYGKELEATARAWLVLAERIEQAEALEECVVQRRHTAESLRAVPVWSIPYPAD